MRKFDDQFMINPDTNYDWVYTSGGKDQNATEDDFQAYRNFFKQSIYWALFWFVIGLSIIVYVFIDPVPYPSVILTQLIVGFGFGLVLSAGKTVEGAFYKALDYELWTTNLSDKFGARPKIQLESPFRTWWNFNKPALKYLGFTFPFLFLIKKVTVDSTFNFSVAVFVSLLILIITIIWIFYDHFSQRRLEKITLQEKVKKQLGNREWEKHQRELNAKLNPNSSKEKKLKESGKVTLKKYKGPVAKK